MLSWGQRAQAALKTTRGMGTHIHSSWFWGQDARDQGASMVSSWRGAPSWLADSGLLAASSRGQR